MNRNTFSRIVWVYFPIPVASMMSYGLCWGGPAVLPSPHRCIAGRPKGICRHRQNRRQQIQSTALRSQGKLHPKNQFQFVHYLFPLFLSCNIPSIVKWICHLHTYGKHRTYCHSPFSQHVSTLFLQFLSFYSSFPHFFCKVLFCLIKVRVCKRVQSKYGLQLQLPPAIWCWWIKHQQSTCWTFKMYSQGLWHGSTHLCSCWLLADLNQF